MITDRETGLLVDFFDGAAIANALDRVLEDDALRK